MSRERSYDYRIQPRTPEIEALWMDLCENSHQGSLLSTRVCNGGSSNPEGVSVWLYANRTKARRVAAELDRYFGTSGELVSESVIMAELDASEAASD